MYLEMDNHATKHNIMLNYATYTRNYLFGVLIYLDKYLKLDLQIIAKHDQNLGKQDSLIACPLLAFRNG